MVKPVRRRNGTTGTGLRERRAAGELEDRVLAVLWSERDAMTPAQVQAAIGDDIAYTTVLTVLSRLLTKGVVDRARSGRAYAYRPRVDPDARVADEMHRLLQRRTDRETVLAHFVDGLSLRDERVLRRLMGDG